MVDPAQKRRGRKPISAAVKASNATELALKLVNELVDENLLAFSQLADDAEIRKENARLLVENDRLRATLAETVLERDALSAHLMKGHRSRAEVQ